MYKTNTFEDILINQSYYHSRDCCDCLSTIENNCRRRKSCFSPEHCEHCKKHVSGICTVHKIARERVEQKIEYRADDEYRKIKYCHECEHNQPCYDEHTLSRCVACSDNLCRLHLIVCERFHSYYISKKGNTTKNPMYEEYVKRYIEYAGKSPLNTTPIVIHESPKQPSREQTPITNPFTASKKTYIGSPDLNKLQDLPELESQVDPFAIKHINKNSQYIAVQTPHPHTHTHTHSFGGVSISPISDYIPQFGSDISDLNETSTYYKYNYGTYLPRFSDQKRTIDEISDHDNLHEPVIKKDKSSHERICELFGELVKELTINVADIDKYAEQINIINFIIKGK